MGASAYDIRGVDLSGERYTVEQSLLRNQYTASDADGNTVLEGSKKLFRLKEQFPFTDTRGEEVFEVRAESVVDVAGDYVLTDSRTGEEVVILDNDYSTFRDTWTVRDADTEAALAKITSRGALVTLARHYLPLGRLIPHRYEITGPDGTHVGSIDGQFSVRDRYEITVDDASDVPAEATVAAAMVIDAIQGH